MACMLHVAWGERLAKPPYRRAPAGWPARFAPWLRATLRSEHAYRRLLGIKASLDPQ
jgi:hypothetical protein